MTDPYKVLGISPNASDEDVKKAYRDLARKYHPDKYTDEALKRTAEERMKEINAAYDEILRTRQGKNGGRNGSYSYQSGARAPIYEQIRHMIVGGNLAAAYSRLMEIPEESRVAEWYFLLGVISQRQGNYGDAMNCFDRACRMDPENMEYRQAMNAMNRRAGSYSGGYNVGNEQGCSTCDICSTFLILDCCCRSMCR